MRACYPEITLFKKKTCGTSPVIKIETWGYSKMQKNSWIDKITNEELYERTKEREVWKKIEKREEEKNVCA